MLRALQSTMWFAFNNIYSLKGFNVEETVIRLSKLMSDRGLCSRREADVYIALGQVMVNGEVVSTLGTKVPLDVEITLKDQAQAKQEGKVTIILNKPVGYVCSSEYISP